MIQFRQMEFDPGYEGMLPVSVQVKQLNAAPLKLDRTTTARLSAPGAGSGPVKSAVEQVIGLFLDHCGGVGPGEDTLPVVLSLVRAPDGEEGYSITLSAEEIRIVGYGKRGLLEGVTTLIRLCRWEEGACTLPAMEVTCRTDCPPGCTD